MAHGIPLCLPHAWVDDLIIKDDYQAVLALKEIGADALPYVTPNLKKKSTWANTLWAMPLAKIASPASAEVKVRRTKQSTVTHAERSAHRAGSGR